MIPLHPIVSKRKALNIWIFPWSCEIGNPPFLYAFSSFQLARWSSSDVFIAAEVESSSRKRPRKSPRRSTISACKSFSFWLLLGGQDETVQMATWLGETETAFPLDVHMDGSVFSLAWKKQENSFPLFHNQIVPSLLKSCWYLTGKHPFSSLGFVCSTQSYRTLWQ